jgi:hypothetical protein
MAKLYHAPGLIDEKRINKLVNGGSVMMNDKGDKEVNLHFKKLKDYNRYVKNVVAGKGFNLNIDKHLHDITDHMGGSLRSIGRSISHAFNNPIAKSVINNVASGAAGIGATALTGNPLAGMAAAGATSAALGSGFSKFMKKHVNKGIKNISNNIQGEIKTALKEIAHDSQVVNKIADQVSHYAGENAGQYASSMAQNTIDNALGGKLKKGGKLGNVMKMVHKIENHGGAVEAEQSMGLGGTRAIKGFSQPLSVQDRMAYVRSHKKTGGSFATL